MKDAPMKKILILTANPKNIDQLRLGEEVREIEAELIRAKKRDQFEVISKWAVSPRDVCQALLDHEPQFVHFSGHGAGEAGLVLEEDGKPKLVSAAALASLFALFTHCVECVVLNACYSKAQADAIGQHIAAVIGMSQAIGDPAAIKFASGFYGAIGAGRSTEDAYKFGCNAIQMDRIPEHLTPVLALNPTIKSSSVNSPEPLEVSVDHYQLYNILTRLTSHDFNRIIVIVDPPHGSIPHNTAPQADRVDALIDWAGSPTGCGLEKVQQALNSLLSRK